MRNERILECAFNEIAVRGIKHANVDNIAAALHISKKTIYDLFENKEKLILSSLKFKIGKIIEGLSNSSNSEMNVLESIIYNAVYLFKFFNSTTPLLFQERSLYRSIEEYIESVKKEMLEIGRKRFEQGISEGYLLESTDFDIVGRLFESQVLVMSKESSERYTPTQICFYSLIIIMRGVCTEKGIAILDEMNIKNVI